MLRIISCGVLAMILSISVGCAQKTEMTAINMTMPDWSQFTGKPAGKSGVGAMAIVKVISRVMINVTGPGIATPVVHIWELHRNSGSGGSIPTPPKEFELTVPRGNQRLIQVLVIVEDVNTTSMDTEGSMVFHYGDQTKTLSSAVETVNIALSPINSSSVEGSLSGRYLNADGSTPSGVVSMYFAPPGKSPMIVDRSSIFSGYFSFFLLPNVPFTYRLENGTTLFDSVTISSFNSGLGYQAIHVAVPQGYQDRGSGPRTYRTERRKVVGFFGPGATTGGRMVCYPGASSISGFYPAATGGSPIYWSPSAAASSMARVINGGLGGACAGTFGSDQFTIEPSRLPSGDAPLPMRGPFQEVTFGNQRTFLSVMPTNPTQLNVDWDYLPGVVGNSVDGVGLFYRIYNAGENIDADEWHDNAPCGSLVSQGFTELTRVATQGGTVSSYVWNSAPMTAYIQGRLKTVACPYSNSKSGYYDFAISHNSSWNSGHLPATKIEILNLTEPGVVSSPMARQKIGETTCAAVRVRTLDALGRRATRQGGVTDLKIVPSDPDVEFYNGPQCLALIGKGTLTLPSFYDEFWLGVKPVATTSATFDITVEDTVVDASSLPSITHYFTKAPQQTPTHIRAVLPDLGSSTPLRAWECYPFAYVSGIPDGTSFITQYLTNLQITHGAAPGAGVYTDGACSVLDSYPVTMAPSPMTTSLSSIMYFMYKGSAPSVSVAPSSSSPPLTITPFNLNVVQPAAPTRLEISGIDPSYYSSCHPVRLVATNDLGQAAPVSANQVVTPTFSSTPQTGEGFYTDISCSPGNEATTLMLPNGEARGSDMFFRWNQTGPLTIGATVIGGLPLKTIETEVSP